MDQATQIQMLRMLGGGGGSMASRAGQALAGRGAQIDAAAGMPPQVPQQPMPQQPAMSQSQFGGAPMTPEQQAMRQQALIMKLRQLGELPGGR